MTADHPDQTCGVCGEPAPPAMLAECNWCGRPYHLNQRNDTDGKDCGRVWIDEQFLALQFACDTCLRDAGLGRAQAAPGRARPAQARRRYRRRE